MTDRMKMIVVALSLYSLAAGVLFGAWMLLSYFPPKENGPELVNWIMLTLGTLIGHILTFLTGDWSNKPAAPTVPTTQGGFASVLRLATIAWLAVGFALLTGCAGLNVSWVATASYNTPATTNAIMTPGADVLPVKAASAP
jgi:hypothetical protein